MPNKGKHITIPPDVLEQLVNYGYREAGASTSKRSLRGFSQRSSDTVKDIDENLYTLWNRSRMLYMDEPYATSALKTIRTNAIGTGLRLKPRLNRDILHMANGEADILERQIQHEFHMWACNKNHCDSLGVNDFYELQQLAFLSSLMSGDVFCLIEKDFKKDPSNPYPLRLRVIEADRVSTPLDADNYNYISPGVSTVVSKTKAGNIIRNGIELDRKGKVVAYHICNAYPNEVPIDGSEKKWTRVLAYGQRSKLPNVLHVMNAERPEQYRGVPLLAQVIDPLEQLRRYTEAELTAAVIEACYTIVWKHADADDELNEAYGEGEEVPHNEYEMQFAPGAVVDADIDDEIQAIDPKRPSSGFKNFDESIATKIGAAIEVPKDVLMKSHSSSYSASRASQLEANKTFKMYRGWFVSDFVQPVYEIWFNEAVASGRIDAPGYFADPIIRAAYTNAEWVGPAMGQIDPVKEVTANVMKINNGLATHEDIATEMGAGDFDHIVDQLKMENDRLQDAAVNTEQNIRYTEREYYQDG